MQSSESREIMLHIQYYNTLSIVTFLTDVLYCVFSECSYLPNMKINNNKYLFLLTPNAFIDSARVRKKIHPVFFDSIFNPVLNTSLKRYVASCNI